MIPPIRTSAVAPDFRAGAKEKKETNREKQEKGSDFRQPGLEGISCALCLANCAARLHWIPSARSHCICVYFDHGEGACPSPSSDFFYIAGPGLNLESSNVHDSRPKFGDFLDSSIIAEYVDSIAGSRWFRFHAR